MTSLHTSHAPSSLSLSLSLTLEHAHAHAHVHARASHPPLPRQYHLPLRVSSGRSGSLGSVPCGTISSTPLPPQQNGADRRSRSSSNSSRSSVDSIIEEFEERRKSLERKSSLSRKYSAPEISHRRWSGETGESTLHGRGKLGTRPFIFIIHHHVAVQPLIYIYIY